MTAFKSQEDLQTTAPYEPSPSPSLDALIITFDIMFRPLLNSLTFTIAATVLSCVIGSITGFVLSKFRFRVSDTVFLIIIVGIFIPYQAVLVPLFLIMVQWHLYETLLALIITHTAYGVPICTLLFRSFYEELPDSLIKAAITDGAGIMRIYRRIVLPLSP
ncbi:MAG: carbohydrate ABC transporter permease, partial [Promethearchaeota archaeon]